MNFLIFSTRYCRNV